MPLVPVRDRYSPSHGARLGPGANDAIYESRSRSDACAVNVGDCDHSRSLGRAFKSIEVRSARFWRQR
jgi:hypothetical protein